MSKVRFGTAYFMSKYWVIRYYGKELAEYNLKHNVCFIGMPELRKGQRLFTDEDGRYFIEEDMIK